MKILLTGATGFVGRSLVPALHQDGHELTLWVRDRAKALTLFPQAQFPRLTAIALGDSEILSSMEGQDGVINLAGEPISQRWTPAYKQVILQSREGITTQLVQAISQAPTKPRVMISASAIGYYGTSETATFTETSPAGQDFLAQVCQAWEAAAQPVTEMGVRLVILRLGIVLGSDGGALGKMLPPFKVFAGGPLGKGQQWFSWIDRTDTVALIQFALNDSTMAGVFNATAPEPVSMAMFCQTLGTVLDRPSWLPVPEVALELLLGEGAMLVLEGQKVLPQAIAQTGFQFQYPTLEASLRHCLA